MAYALVFPGQGSQKVGMCAALSEAFPVVRATFDDASKVLGKDLWALSQVGPAEVLNQTQNTQPALLAADVAVYRVWQAHCGVVPSVMAGHSLGEYAALVCAGVIDFADAIRLVALRGEAMQAAVPVGEGAMAAVIGLDDAALRALCEEASHLGTVSPANYNSVGQTVVAGSAAAVEAVIAGAKPAGAKLAKMIPVSVPSHCALMAPAQVQLEAALADVMLSAPSIPVIQNVTVQAHTTPEDIRADLAAQLTQPVRWVETIQAMAELGVTQVLECGPGKVLTGLNKRIDAQLTLASLGESVEGLPQTSAQVKEKSHV